MIVEPWLCRAAAERPRGVAIEAGGEAVSYERLLAAAALGAERLRERGVRAGERVAIALSPGIDFAVALHATWLAEAVAVPIDLRLAARERASNASGSAAILEEPLLSRAERERASAPPRLSARHELDATAAIIHTSGTTSEPKRVELSFANFLWSALGSAVALGSDPNERWLSTLPVCHVGGLSILVRSAIAASTAVVHERFDTEEALHALRQRRITLVSVVATTLARLLDAGLERPPSLRLALAGGGPVPPALLARAAEAGVPVAQTYGLTESCSQASTVPLAALVSEAARPAQDELAGEAGERIAALGAGRPLFCTTVRVAACGEILLAGPTIAAGSVSEDGFLHTGDLGTLDEHGNLHVTGRKADTIISGGENVAPAEVEAALEAHPGVREAAVLGLPDSNWGEAIVALVVARDEDSLRAEHLRRHCGAALAPFKVPKRFLTSELPLPRTRSGKLLRRELPELAGRAADLADRDGAANLTDHAAAGAHGGRDASAERG
ncbi:MAG: AMP-binding protein [Solirubrobacteraceae bacterium]